MQEMRVQSLSQEDCLEKGMATCSSILTWGIPGTEEHGGLQFLGLQSRIRLSTHTLQNGALFPHRDGGERNIYRKERCRLFRDLFPLVCHQRSPSCHLLLHLSGVRALVQMFSGLVREEHFFEKGSSYFLNLVSSCLLPWSYLLAIFFFFLLRNLKMQLLEQGDAFEKDNNFVLSFNVLNKTSKYLTLYLPCARNFCVLTCME